MDVKKFDTKGTILAEKLGNEVAMRGLLEVTRVDRNEVAITLPTSKLAFLVWIDPDAVDTQGVVFRINKNLELLPGAELVVKKFDASVGLGMEVLKEVLETMLERRMAHFVHFVEFDKCLASVYPEVSHEIELEKNSIIEINEVLRRLEG